MNNYSDPLFARYADLDFSDAKPISQIPALAKLQAEHSHESLITLSVDQETLAIFKAQAEISGGSYKTLINDVLKQVAHDLMLTDRVRETLGQTLHK